MTHEVKEGERGEHIPMSMLCIEWYCIAFQLASYYLVEGAFTFRQPYYETESNSYAKRHSMQDEGGEQGSPRARKQKSRLLELSLGEKDVFVDFGVVFEELQLLGQCARVLALYVEKSRACSTQQLHQYSGALLCCHHLPYDQFDRTRLQS